MALEITTDNIADATSSGVALLDFYTTWCGPCRMIAPVIEQLSQEYAGRATIGKIDADAQRELATRFEVMGFPTILILKDGEVVERLAGAGPQTSKPALAKLLEEHAGAADESAAATPAGPITVTSANVADTVGSGIALLDFYTDMCGPCKQIAPIITQIADEYAGKVKVGKVNAADELELAQEYDVMGVPALLFFKEGELVDRRAGFGPHTSKAGLSSVLDGLLRNADAGKTLDWF
ncbi:MAG: thioredoxin 1 [Rhodothermales bacterium]|jgi:thioredoxin 1